MCEREEYYRMNFKRNFKNELLTTIATLLQDICEENDFSNLQNDDLIKPFIGKIENMSVEDFFIIQMQNQVHLLLCLFILIDYVKKMDLL